ncbi:MAG TPA: hypothetical protein VEQ41_01610 [Solirubrobacterales bacterium]|nr:hypothetical protein [Solirubrobacterales bacterium]
MIHKLYTRLLAAAGATLIAAALFAPAATAQEPAPGFERFAGCPSPEENPDIVICMRTVIDGGHFKMGSKEVPIVNPITLSGGTNFITGALEYNSKGGLEPVKQPIPGGLVGLTGLDWLVNFLNLEQLKVYAVTELAGEPSSPLEEPVTMPIKVRLINPALGNNCYVGSNSNPIVLNLTTKTTNPPPPNEPITGVEPEFVFDEEAGLIFLNNGVFVDNEFAAPGATGCKLNVLGLPLLNIDALINAQSGLPSPAGTNETVQTWDGEAAEAITVYP